MATRLRPVTEKIPKSLVAINGEPFIAHQLKLLASNGISHVVVCAGFLGKMICDVIGDGSQFGVTVEYAFDGDRLLGTAGAVKNALRLLGDSFFVLYGDSYLVCDYGAAEGKFWASGKLALMTVYRNEGKWDTSNVEFENGHILAYSKKVRTPRMHYIDYGLGVFSSKVFDQIPPGKPYDLAELYAKMLEQGQLAGMEVHQRFYEIGSPSGLEETERFLTKEKVGQQ